MNGVLAISLPTRNAQRASPARSIPAQPNTAQSIPARSGTKALPDRQAATLRDSITAEVNARAARRSTKGTRRERAEESSLAEGSLVAAVIAEHRSEAAIETPFFAGPENALVAHLVRRLLNQSRPSNQASPSNHQGASSAATNITAVGNPCILFGVPGVGKSHLAQGLAEHWRRELGSSAVVSIAAKDLARELAEAVETRGVRDLRRRLLQAQRVVIEDLEQLAGSAGAVHESAQQELTHLLDEWVRRDVFVLLTADRAPAGIEALSLRLRTRLAGGLNLEVVLPGLATRLAYVQALAGEMGLKFVSPAEAILADQLVGPLTLIRGACLTLREAALREGTDGIILPEAVVAQVGHTRERVPKLPAIAAEAARHFSLKVADLKGPNRSRFVSRARGVAMLLMRELTDASFEEIGKYLGSRDHTTVLHGCRRTTELLADDVETQQAIQTIRRNLA